MEFHGFTRKELQTLCKKNKIPANMTNIAMADALAALQYVEGLDKLMNQSSQSQEKIVPETPSIVNRTKPTNEDPKTAQARRTTRRAMDQENKNVAETPAASRRKTQVAASSVHMRTRQSVRLLEKTMAELSLKNEARAQTVLVEMDFLDQTQLSGMCLWKYHVDDDNDKANTDETEPVDISVTENDASGEVMSIADTDSDEISAKVTDDVDVDADQREDQIIASQQLKIGRGTELDFENLKADSNKLDPDASDTDTDDDSDSQMSVLFNEADSNQVASKDSASDADADDDSDSQKSVANQQEINLIAEADSNQFPNESISAEAADLSASETDADDDSGSQKSVADQLDMQTTAECVEELVDVSLVEASEDEIPNSNYVQQISPSTLENTVKNLVNVYVMPAEEFGMALPAIAKQTNDSDSGVRPTQSASNQVDNKENVDSSGMIMIMKVEAKKDEAKKIKKIVDDNSELNSLHDKSLRQLNKMLKEKLQISNNNKNNEQQNITKKQVGNKPRPALQTLPENQMLAGEPNYEIVKTDQLFVCGHFG